jgi:hypothetical protein
MVRGRISYGVGSKHNPGDPWGHSSLTIEPDGNARLEQDTRGGLFIFTGTVVAAALDEFWKAIDESGFPEVPEHRMPAGSASRSLTIGSQSPRLPVAYHAVGKLPGYATAFRIIDAVIRQLSLEMVKEGQPGPPIVEGAQRVT